MQLKTGIQRGVTLAVTALLGVQAGQNVLAEEKQWDFDSVLFTYMEGDSRVSDVSLRLEAVRSGETEEQLTLGLSVDALSGASPSGAIPTHTPQTVTTPSGNTNVYAAELPLNSFTDRRIAGQAAYLFPLGDQNRLSTGFTLSQEDDYRHAGVNASFSQDFFDRNTTISAGFGLSADSIDPVDGIPLALSNSDLGSTTTSAENKNVTDLLFGVTQILSPRSLVQLNYGYSSATGYLNDPYKIISQVNSNGVVQSNLYENRPDSRAGHNLYGAIKFDNQGDVTTFSYRYHSDDWDISSSTFDLRHRLSLGENGHYIEPHLRFYNQSAADFYRLQLPDSEAVPTHISADYRLAKFSAITLGFRYGIKGPWGNDWRINLEYYQQNPSDNTSDYVDQAGLDLNPGVSALIFSIGARF
ncbi:MAG: DUF3570 domain-containing protein [Acidiferrobacteraceae bacterium]|jgi:hypothetical protein|nr:DUF3570 domain-containing protein [Acidiferrobacteraceae bacterium]